MTSVVKNDLGFEINDPNYLSTYLLLTCYESYDHCNLQTASEVKFYLRFEISDPQLHTYPCEACSKGSVNVLGIHDSVIRVN